MAALLLAVLLALTSCSKTDTPAESASASGEAERVAVQVAPAERRTLRRLLETTADLKPAREVKVASLISERIVSFGVENGDFVEQGSILAEIRSDALQQAIVQLDGEIAAVDAELTAKKLDLDRGRKLYRQHSISRQAFEQLQTGYDAVAARKASLIANRAQLLINEGNSTIRAPISGVVANKTLQVGDLASPQVTLCSLYEIDVLKVTLRVGEYDSTRVMPGQPVQLAVNAWPDRTFEGRIARVLPYLDPADRNATVEIELPNPLQPETGRRELSPGMFGSAVLVIEERPDALSVPARALVFQLDAAGQEVESLFVIDAQGRATLRQPTLGLREDRYVEVLSGVHPGELVVVVGQQALREGNAVEIVSEEGAPTEPEPAPGQGVSSQVPPLPAAPVPEAAQTPPSKAASEQEPPTQGSPGVEAPGRTPSKPRVDRQRRAPGSPPPAPPQERRPASPDREGGHP